MNLELSCFEPTDKTVPIFQGFKANHCRSLWFSPESHTIWHLWEHFWDCDFKNKHIKIVNKIGINCNSRKMINLNR